MTSLDLSRYIAMIMQKRRYSDNFSLICPYAIRKSYLVDFSLLLNAGKEKLNMKKWYDEEYEWEIEVIGFNKDNEETERFCRNGEEIGDKYTCTYGCPVNAQGQGICSKVMMMMYPIMEAVRSGGDLENIGGDSKYSKVIMCPDGCVLFRLTAKPLGNQNFFKGKFFD